MEIKKYKPIGEMVERSRIGGGSFVAIADFDRVTAERDALQLRLNAVEEENDRLACLVGEKRSKIRELVSEQDRLLVKIMRIEHNSPALQILKSLPENLLSLSGCENTCGVSACIDYIRQELIELEKRP